MTEPVARWIGPLQLDATRDAVIHLPAGRNLQVGAVSPSTHRRGCGNGRARRCAAFLCLIHDRGALPPEQHRRL